MTRSMTVKTLAKRMTLTVGLIGAMVAIAPAASAAPAYQTVQTQSQTRVIVTPHTQMKPTQRAIAAPRYTVKANQLRPGQRTIVVKRPLPAQLIQPSPAPRVIVVKAPKRTQTVVTVTPRRR